MIVNIYSRDEFIKKKYNLDEYYVCINSSGGPDSVSIMKFNSDKVKNYWFDDVEKDEYKWGEDVQQWFHAKAMTFDQSNDLYNFLDSIPQESVVNVYCSKGISRSGAVGEFLKREKNAVINCSREIYPNKRVISFLYNSKNKYVQVIKFKFSLDELRSYYYDLENNFNYLKWTLDYAKDVNNIEKHKVEGFYGWGIQSNLENLSEPCPPYDIHKNGLTIYRNTELVFGIIEKILIRFPYARQLGIAVHPKEVRIAEHIDNEEYVKIHFPIFKTDSSYFVFGEHKFILEPGNGYLIDTRYPHSTQQEGSGNRVHLLLKLPVDKIKDALL